MFPHFGFHVLFKFSHFTFSLVNNVNMITGSWCACGMFAFEEYYGTALKATYSVFEATFSGSWPLLARNLIRDVSEWCLSCTFFYFAMLYFLAFSCNVIVSTPLQYLHCFCTVHKVLHFLDCLPGGYLAASGSDSDQISTRLSRRNVSDVSDVSRRSRSVLRSFVWLR